MKLTIRLKEKIKEYCSNIALGIDCLQLKEDLLKYYHIPNHILESLEEYAKFNYVSEDFTMEQLLKSETIEELQLKLEECKISNL